MLQSISNTKDKQTNQIVFRDVCGQDTHMIVICNDNVIRNYSMNDKQLLSQYKYPNVKSFERVICVCGDLKIFARAVCDVKE